VRFYTVKAGDECLQIAEASKMSVQQLMQFNPSINQACTNLQPVQQLCLRQAAEGSGSGSDCAGGSSYIAAAGDTCSSIAAAASISAAELISANPSINGACTNLQIGQRVCIPASSPRPACSQQYTVQTGDTCQSIHLVFECDAYMHVFDDYLRNLEIGFPLWPTQVAVTWPGLCSKASPVLLPSYTTASWFVMILLW
jgi:LysM repeat protein